MNSGDESDKSGEVTKERDSNNAETVGEHWKEDMRMAKRASLSQTLR